MNPIIHGSVVRVALTIGLVAGASLILSASTYGIETLLPHPAAIPAGPANIQLAQADAAPVQKPVSYTSEQADRGKKTFVKECVDCHGDNLRGGMNGGPPLRGNAFEQKFAEGSPASGMFLFMSTLMPPNDPGRYSPSVYADLMAYILQVNGFQEGAALPHDEDALDNLIVEK